MRRPFGHRRALASRRVAGPDKRPDVDLRQTKRAQFFLNAGQRNLQIALDVVAEGFERRNVNDVRGIVEFSFNAQVAPGRRWQPERRRAFYLNRWARRSKCSDVL